jgi:hypothetical protein
MKDFSLTLLRGLSFITCLKDFSLTHLRGLSFITRLKDFSPTLLRGLSFITLLKDFSLTHLRGFVIYNFLFAHVLIVLFLTIKPSFPNLLSFIIYQYIPICVTVHHTTTNATKQIMSHLVYSLTIHQFSTYTLTEIKKLT